MAALAMLVATPTEVTTPVKFGMELATKSGPPIAITLEAVPLTSPTASSTTSTTQIATTAFVQAQKISPAFTGTPTAPTAIAGTNTTQLATTAFTTDAVATLEASTTATTNSLQALKAPLASPAFTGTPTAPSPNDGDVSQKIATTAFVRSSSPVLSVAGLTGAVTLLVTDIVGAAPIAAPSFTGDVKAPTPPYGTNSIIVATLHLYKAKNLALHSPAYQPHPLPWLVQQTLKLLPLHTLIPRYQILVMLQQ